MRRSPSATAQTSHDEKFSVGEGSDLVGRIAALRHDPDIDEREAILALEPLLAETLRAARAAQGLASWPGLCPSHRPRSPTQPRALRIDRIRETMPWERPAISATRPPGTPAFSAARTAVSRPRAPERQPSPPWQVLSPRPAVAARAQRRPRSQAIPWRRPTAVGESRTRGTQCDQRGRACGSSLRSQTSTAPPASSRKRARCRASRTWWLRPPRQW